MSVTYVPYAGESVSREWGIVLRAADRANVPFSITEGHRTFARQQYFWNGWIRRLPGFNKAAFPSHSAPHIRTGRIDHAIDVNQLDGGVYRLAAFIRKHGGRVFWEVPGEPWHIWVPASDLRMLAAKFATKPDSHFLTKAERGHVRILQAERRVAKRHGGWDKVDPSHLKRARYHKNWLEKRVKWLTKSNLNRSHRRERLRAIRRVI